jgi:F-type H+-transporting ATPase subunit gamma
VQKPELEQLLPIGKLRACRPRHGADEPQARAGCREYVFEPDADEVLGAPAAALPRTARSSRSLLEAKAVRAGRAHGRDEERHRQRQAASIKDLTLEYNKLRQANITKELLEITSGADGAGLRSIFDSNRHYRHEQGKIVQIIGPVVDVEFTANAARRSTTR